MVLAEGGRTVNAMENPAQPGSTSDQARPDFGARAVTPRPAPALASVPSKGAGLSCPARLIGLKDAGYASRLAWLREWLPEADALPYEDANTRLLSQADRSFFILALHGNDLRRMGRIIRDWRAIFPDKPIVALMSHSTPTGRAELFRSGADFVYDLSMPEDVAEAALASAISRWPATAERGRVEFYPMVRLTRLLSPTEAAIAKVLCENQGQIVPYATILRRLGKADTRDGVKCLQVQMRRLRSKVVSGLRIENRASVGYRASLN